MLTIPVVDNADTIKKTDFRKLSARLRSILRARDIAAGGIQTASRRNKNFPSLIRKKSLTFPLARRISATKFVAPISISTIAMISIARLLYSPILFSFVENPPVDKEHIQWQILSNHFMPAMRYAMLPKTRHAL